MTNRLRKIAIYAIVTLVVPLLVLVGVDNTFGWALKNYYPIAFRDVRTFRQELAEDTDPLVARRVGHPFAQFVLNYKNPELMKNAHVNSLGYTDDEFVVAKEPGEYRILAFGGSTTVGYEAWPNKLQDYLNAQAAHTPYRRFTVYNFGIEGYTSMHSAVTMAMHGVDYKPDMIIVHDSYNDTVPMFNAGFRNDYAHTYKSWLIENVDEYPSLLIHLIRHSELAGFATFYVINKGVPRPMKDGAYVSPSGREFYVQHPQPAQTADAPPYVFKRNLNTMRLLAADVGAKMMVLTGPYRGNVGKDTYVINDYVRDFQHEHPGVILCDLQTFGAEFEPHYTDIMHLTESGQKVKGEIVGKAVIASFSKGK